MPAIVFTSVDLPAPLSPTKPTTSPDATSMSTRSSACTAPNLLLTPRSESKGWSAFISILSRSAGCGRAGEPARPHPPCLLDSRCLARRRVRGRADLRHREEVVLHHRVLDVALGDRHRGEDHRGDALPLALRLLVHDATGRLLVVQRGHGKIGRVSRLGRDRL